MDPDWDMATDKPPTLQSDQPTAPQEPRNAQAVWNTTDGTESKAEKEEVHGQPSP